MFQSFKKSIFLTFILLISLSNCGIPKVKKVDKNIPISGEERARKNVEEGRGISLSNFGKQSTNYDFSTANPMWRASLELLDFIPLVTVDYSGGMIITDWYNEKNSDNEYLKITIQFLNKEISASNLKITVHKKNCTNNQNCSTNKFSSKINNELLEAILTKAAIIEKENKSKK